jgi:hypothetical protein
LVVGTCSTVVVVEHAIQEGTVGIVF